MVTREEVKGHWNTVTGRLKEHWGQLTDDDFARARGNADQLVGAVQKKTGATKAEIEAIMTRASEEAASAAAYATDTAQRYAGQAKEMFAEGFSNASEQASVAAKQAARAAKKNPGATIAVAVGIGLLAGLFLGSNRR